MRPSAPSPAEALEDENGAAAEPAGFDRSLRLGRLLRRVLGCDAQRDASLRGQLTKLQEPVGSLEDGAHPDRVDLDGQTV